MKKAPKLMVIVPALSLILASGAFAQYREMDREDYNPPPNVIIESEMPPPLSSDVQSEKTNRTATHHLEEYKEKDQGVPTGMSPQSNESWMSQDVTPPAPKHRSKKSQSTSGY